MDEDQRKGTKIVIPASWDVTGALREGTGSTSSSGEKAVLPHSKRGQEISAGLAKLLTCRSLPKITACPGGAPLAEWEILHRAL